MGGDDQRVAKALGVAGQDAEREPSAERVTEQAVAALAERGEPLDFVVEAAADGGVEVTAEDGRNGAGRQRQVREAVWGAREAVEAQVAHAQPRIEARSAATAA